MSENVKMGLVINLISRQSKIQKRLSAALSVYGTGLSGYLVLNQLYVATNQKRRRSNLAEHVGLSPFGVTWLLNPIEKMGLIEKSNNPRDARVSLVALSEAGKKITEETKVSFKYSSAASFDSLEKNG